MDFYVIPTLKNLELTYAGDRIFCLAHFYKQSEEYRAFFLNLRDKFPKAHITLDNSAAERALVTEQVLIDIVRELRPTEVIAPDILFDTDQTIANLDSFVLRLTEEGLLGQVAIFGCPQGKTVEDWVRCYDYMLEHPRVTVIGMSKIAIPYAWLEDPKPDQGILESRHQAVEFLERTGRVVKPLHFLGMGDPTEYRAYARTTNPLFRSSDSCYAVLAATEGIDFWTSPEKRLVTTEDFYNIELTPAQIALALKNVAFLKWHTNY